MTLCFPYDYGLKSVKHLNLKFILLLVLKPQNLSISEP